MKDETLTDRYGAGVEMAGVRALPPICTYLLGQRQAQGWSLQEAADAIGITKVHLWELEKGRSLNPRIKTLALISCAYDCDLGDLALLAACSAEGAGYEARPFDPTSRDGLSATASYADSPQNGADSTALRETDREYLRQRLVHHQGNGLSVAEAQRRARADATLPTPGGSDDR